MFLDAEVFFYYFPHLHLSYPNNNLHAARSRIASPYNPYLSASGASSACAKRNAVSLEILSMIKRAIIVY